MGAFKLAAAFLAVVNAAPYEVKQTSAINPDDYVYVNGTRLYDSNGLHYITGMNYWACMNLAADASAGGNYSRLVIELDQMAQKGINHLRIMAASEGAPTPQPFRMNPALMEAPGKYNDKIFEGLDICLDEMSKRGMRATMTLNNEWQWSGGFAQYVSWATNDSKIPYPSSWNLTAPPQRATPGTGWGAYTVVGTNAAPYNEFTNYANRMYGIEQAETWYKDHIKTVMTRKNTVNGRIYNADPTVMTWQLANEPQAAYSGLDTTPDDALFPWVDRISTYIRTMSPKQLISVGLESKQGEYYFKEVHKHKNVDYATSHLWVQNWGYYSDLDPTKLSLWTALTFAKNFLQDTSKWASDVGKPIFLEEFGMARNNWENTFKEYRYLSSAGTSHKDEYFNAVIGRVMDDFRSGKPYIGTSPWAYGGIYRPETQRVNQFGFLGAGDPPHESPGWYDLYDTDEAMNIVHSQQKDIAEWIENNSQK